MTLITVASQKGGVAKTTTAVSIASCLATLDPVLLIDLDHQSHVALSFGLDAQGGLFDWLMGHARLEECLIQPRPGSGGALEILPGDSRTKTAETFFGARVGGAVELVTALRGLQWPWVVCDTAPGGLLAECALQAADLIVIPFEAETFGVDGVLGTKAVVETLNADAPILLLPTSFDRRLKDHRDTLPAMLAEYGEDMVCEPVPARSAVKQATAVGQTIWEFNHPGIIEVRVAYALLLNKIRALTVQREARLGI